MVPREVKVELVAVVLYLLVVVTQDRDSGMRAAARACRWYASRCRDVGNWAYTQAIRGENWARELIAP